MHDRQQFVSAGYWQDLPRVDSSAGYFDVKPSRCTKCGNSDCFDPVPQQVQNLNCITTGGALNSLQA
ncbi:hypothetical protein OEZ85_004409 [Tetradesmus obliquus]|uniref:Uncharacterized protein n=1 Tax=Tetradesmus obliquus TaxID=3088 RepID=A0ABY8UL30_TETOB|nr:hypothetical protein OEZ85_004409 [Tetradesmus obliquus]